MPQRDIARDVQRQRRLAHRRPRRQNNQLGGLQARRFIVEPGVAGGEPGDAPPFAEYFLEAFEAVPDHFLDADQPGADAILGQLKNRVFGAVEDSVRLVPRRQRLLLNGRRGMNQAAQNGLFLHDARVVLHVGDARQPVGQLRNVRHAARRFEHPVAAEVLHQRDRVDRVALFGELDHALEDVAMLGKEEILGTQPLHGGIQHVIIEQHRAQDAALRFDIAGKRSFEGYVSRSRHSL